MVVSYLLLIKRTMAFLYVSLFQVPDVIKLKCTAKIGNAYWESVVETAVLKKHGRMLESRSNRAVSGDCYLASFIS